MNERKMYKASVDKRKKLTVVSHGRRGARSCVPVEDFTKVVEAELD